MIKDHWDLKYKDVSIWSYLRFLENGVKITSYRPKIRIYLEDFNGLFLFMLLPLIARNRQVYFLPARTDLIEYCKSFCSGDAIFFLRAEGNNKGNVILIEALRHFIRKTAWLFAYKKYKFLINEYAKIQTKYNGIQLIKNAIGDYWFNSLISIFLKNCEVYYTNCVVPQLESYMGKINSHEIQHGVIHKWHLDYASIPKGLIKNKLIVWSEFDKNKLSKEIGFTGLVVVKKFRNKEDKKIRYAKILYGTVDIDFSNSIDKLNNTSDILIQLHPRDYYGYKNIKDKLIYNVNPMEVDEIYVSDSTIIKICKLNNKKFTYIQMDKENIQEIKVRLYEKYSVVAGLDYEIKKINEILNY